MAINFRNKQWFKNMSQERKNDICKRFDTDEKTLRKAGRETEDGRIVIDLLRMDHLIHTPNFWDDCYNAYVKNDIFNNSLKWDFVEVNDMVLQMSSLYNFVNFDAKFIKYKSSLKNDLFVKEAYKHVLNWVNKAKNNITDKDYVKFCSYQIFIQTRCLFETDLKLIKQ